MTTDIYTDGSCLGNPGPGGWAAIVVSDGAERELTGAAPWTALGVQRAESLCRGHGGVPRLWLYHPLPGQEGGRGDGRGGCRLPASTMTRTSAGQDTP